jgi:ankyrin repeat protein
MRSNRWHVRIGTTVFHPVPADTRSAGRWSHVRRRIAESRTAAQAGQGPAPGPTARRRGCSGPDHRAAAPRRRAAGCRGARDAVHAQRGATGRGPRGGLPDLDATQAWTGLAGLDAVVDAALADAPFAAATLAADPALPWRSLPLAAAIGADEVALALLAERPERATRPDGPRGWTPLLYACSARLGRGDPAVAAGRVRIAARLLDLGADPNEDVDSYESRHSPLRNAVREAASVELVDLLLRAGAGGPPPRSSRAGSAWDVGGG